MQLYLSMFHLNPQVLSKYPTQLSGGMRQRVSIIQSLMFDPELLLLDEPFSALDYYTKLSLEEEFCNLVKEKNKSAILVTHDIEEAVSMGTRAFIMSGGKLAKEFHIRKKSEADIARGSEEFAKHYREIWSELKTIISG
jgi:NitT/TauT family transport system ATP-binding protein